MHDDRRLVEERPLTGVPLAAGHDGAIPLTLRPFQILTLRLARR
jgi:hypothetical protein